ncbi:MAG TPA: CYTH domain-containing protein [Rudaea sp.]
MAIEIERKFAVISDAWRGAVERSQRFVQGYLNEAHTGNARCSVRVRIGGERAWLSIKAAVRGVERAEYEYEIPLADAEALLRDFSDARVEKTRHYVTHAGMLFEVDEFSGANAGLVVAEIELESADQAFEHPPWLGGEVSHEARYYNVHLVHHPFSRWSEAERAAHAAASQRTGE